MRQLLNEIQNFPEFGRERVTRTIVEIYSWILDRNKARLAKAKHAACGLALFQLTADLWTSKITGRKFIGVRVIS